MKLRAFAISAALLAPAAASADVWKVTEGADGKTKGTWDISMTGPSFKGVATMTGPGGQAVKYNIAGSQQNGGYVFQRIQPSDGVTCAYIGKSRGANAIGGTSMCNGVNTPWSAVKGN